MSMSYTTEDGNLSQALLDEIMARCNYTEERRSVKLMIALTKARGDLFLLLSDDALAKWWGAKVEDARKSIDRRRQSWVTYRHKRDAWNRLSADERRVLGIRKPQPPKSVDPDGIGTGTVPLDNKSES